MGASRQSYRISIHWKWGGKTYEQKIVSIFKLFKSTILNKWERKMFVKDNFTQPFDKLIGCKIFGHDFMYDSEDQNYFCRKCWKRISEQQHESIERRRKLIRIKSRI